MNRFPIKEKNDGCSLIPTKHKISTVDQCAMCAIFVFQYSWLHIFISLKTSETPPEPETYSTKAVYCMMSRWNSKKYRPCELLSWNWIRVYWEYWWTNSSSWMIPLFSEFRQLCPSALGFQWLSNTVYYLPPLGDNNLVNLHVTSWCFMTRNHESLTKNKVLVFCSQGTL